MDLGCYSQKGVNKNRERYRYGYKHIERCYIYESNDPVNFNSTSVVLEMGIYEVVCRGFLLL